MRRSVRAVAATAALLAAGCSLLLSPADATQCTTDRDCNAKPALRGYVCTEGMCVPSVIPKDDAGEGCVSTEQCTTLNSGRVSVCMQAGGACTPWQTDQCKYFAGPLSDPNAVVIGSIMPLSARQFDGKTIPLSYVDRVRRAVDLAAKDFETQIPGGFFTADGKRRPFAVLHCDSQLWADGALAALDHLTRVVGAKAIIVEADEDLAAIAAEAAAKQVAIACSDCVGPLPPGPLAWRIAPRLDLEAPMAAWRVAQLETEIKAGPNPPAALKVGVLMTPGRAMEAFYAALTSKLAFNGKTALQNGSNFLAVKTDSPLVTAVNHTSFANQLVAFEPDVVVVVMGDDFPNFYLPLIESKWPAGKRKPSYIVTALNYTATPFLAVLDDVTVRKRVSGTRPAFSTAFQANIDAFAVRYPPENFWEQPDGNYSGFDAFYAMAYAVLAARGQSTLGGPQISAGFERLRGGTMLVDFRPERIGVAGQVLVDATSHIDVRGLWSDLDWNVATRDFESDVSMYCFVKDSGGGLTVNPNAGPKLTTSTGVVSGTYACE